MYDARGLKDKTAITGIGWTEISRNSGVSVLSLAAEACKTAIDDAGLKMEEIDGIVTHNMSDSVMPQQVATCLGLPQLGYHLEYWGGGPASDQTIINAVMAVACGMAKNVVCFRALNGRSGRRIGGGDERPQATSDSQFLIPYGWTSFLHSCAPWIHRHMVEYGTTERQLGALCVSQRHNATMNERAMLRKPITIEDYLASRWVAWPFRLLDICIEVDGAVALVVSSAERAKSLKHSPVYIMGMALGGGPLPSYYGMNIAAFLRNSHTELFGKYISPSLYRMAGITPKDVDIIEFYDEMSIAPLMQLEDFGFCKKGEGGPFIEEGRTKLDGELPVNTHGGFLSEGYLHGLNHVAEAVSQLRGDAGPRQVKDAEIALTTGVGGEVGSALLLRR